MRIRKWLGLALVLAMLFGLFPASALAMPTYGGEISGTWDVELTRSNASGSGPQLAPGNHPEWIDRIGNLPQYAVDFYDWLEANANASGALADPTLGTYSGGNYLYQIAEISGTASFTYTGNAETDAQNAASSAMLADATMVVNYAGAAYGAFDKDHPEVFWLSGRAQYGYGGNYDYSVSGSKGTVYYTVAVYFYLINDDFDIRAAEYRSVSSIQEGIAARDAAVNSILAACPQEDAYAQIYYLNQVLTERNGYNSLVATGNQSAAANSAWECISALTGNAGTAGPVCEGYARAFMVLCDKLGIPCVLVQGYAKSTADGEAGNHMWNYVNLGCQWYAVDVTWNDPYVSNKPDAVLSGYEGNSWVLLGADTVLGEDLSFIQSHIVTNNTTVNSLNYVNGPVLASLAYDTASGGHNYENGVCTNCGASEPDSVTVPTLTAKNISLSVEDEILVNVYFTAENTADVKNYGLLLFSEKVSAPTFQTAIAHTEGWYESNGYLGVTTPGIAAKNMGDTLYFAVYALLSDGSYAYSKCYSYAPTTYANNLLNKTTTTQQMKSLIVAMLNYGAAAQTYFDYNTGALVNAKLTDEQKALVVDYNNDMLDGLTTCAAGKKGTLFGSGNTGFSKRTPSVNFEGAFSVNFYFSQPKATVGSDVTFYVWDKAAYESAATLLPQNAIATSKCSFDGTYYTGIVEGIAAKEVDETFYCAAVYTGTDGNTYVSGVIAYSLGYYLENQASGTKMPDFAKATGVYAYYAKLNFNN